jgi:hypothetical protein
MVECHDNATHQEPLFARKKPSRLSKRVALKVKRFAFHSSFPESETGRMSTKLSGPVDLFLLISCAAARRSMQQRR